MEKDKEYLGHGPGVDPIPVPKHPVAATEKAEDFVGEMMEEWSETLTGDHDDKKAIRESKDR
ncbi:hypothetical protein [Paenibacillus macerans]|uniref:hypothetical protein n=1 Tax=Paenibacillus macerans TaxID=44252 RepID=UPI003D324421